MAGSLNRVRVPKVTVPRAIGKTGAKIPATLWASPTRQMMVVEDPNGAQYPYEVETMTPEWSSFEKCCISVLKVVIAILIFLTVLIFVLIMDGWSVGEYGAPIMLPEYAFPCLMACTSSLTLLFMNEFISPRARGKLQLLLIFLATIIIIHIEAVLIFGLHKVERFRLHIRNDNIIRGDFFFWNNATNHHRFNFIQRPRR